MLLAAAALFIAAALVLMLHGRNAEPPQRKDPAAASADVQTKPPQPTPFSVEGDGVADLHFARRSASQIALTWSEPDGQELEHVTVLRRAASGGDWERRAELDPGVCAYADTLESTEPQQYLYRVDVLPAHSEAAIRGDAIPASNVSVCLDPGHYLGSSALSGTELYGYGEGLFTLRLGLELRAVLEQEYGIAVIMTREADDITIDGFTNAELDNRHLSLRGTYAAGQDLFVSLHTNANQDDVNGAPTCNQPLAINKTIVFVNQVALNSERGIRIANAVLTRLSAENYALGLSVTDRCDLAEVGAAHDWSDAFNDSVDTPGAVCYRGGEEQKDYYGVLRGAASVGVPGLIVEHGLHTVAEVRKAAMQGDLAVRWAQADAAGIAEGFGFTRVHN